MAPTNRARRRALNQQVTDEYSVFRTRLNNYALRTGSQLRLPRLPRLPHPRVRQLWTHLVQSWNFLGHRARVVAAADIF